MKKNNICPRKLCSSKFKC